MSGIFISYRRGDSEGQARALSIELAKLVGEDSVFMDVDSIPIGIDFRTHIDETLQRADVVLAVIGRNWLGQDAGGAVRMNEKTDAVRVEVETALRNRVRIDCWVRFLLSVRHSTITAT